MSKQGEFIKSARRKCGLTQKQLADKLNVSDKVISKWEVGDSFPDYTLLPELAKQLNVEINEILNGEFQQKTGIQKSKISPTINKNNIYIVNSGENKQDSTSNTINLQDNKLNNMVLKCKKCDTNDITIISNDIFQCNKCKTKYRVKNNPVINNTSNVVNNYNIENKNGNAPKTFKDKIINILLFMKQYQNYFFLGFYLLSFILLFLPVIKWAFPAWQFSDNFFKFLFVPFQKDATKYLLGDNLSAMFTLAEKNINVISWIMSIIAWIYVISLIIIIAKLIINIVKKEKYDNNKAFKHSIIISVLCIVSFIVAKIIISQINGMFTDSGMDMTAYKNSGMPIKTTLIWSILWSFIAVIFSSLFKYLKCLKFSAENNINTNDSQNTNENSSKKNHTLSPETKQRIKSITKKCVIVLLILGILIGGGFGIFALVKKNTPSPQNTWNNFISCINDSRYNDTMKYIYYLSDDQKENYESYSTSYAVYSNLSTSSFRQIESDGSYAICEIILKGTMIVSGVQTAPVYKYNVYFVKDIENEWKLLSPLNITLGNNNNYQIDKTNELIYSNLYSSKTAVFYYGDSFESMRLPNDIDSISGTFYAHLTSLNTNNVRNCPTNLRSLTIPNTIKTIENRAFSNFTSITQLYLPKNLSSIGDYAFYSSNSLVNLYYDGDGLTLGNKSLPDSLIFSISYDLGGGVNNSDNPYTYTANTPTFTLKEPTKSGYTFVGWTSKTQTTPTKQYSIKTKNIGNKTVKANWQIITYIIKYNLNGGVNAYTNSTSFNVESGIITLSEPTKTGYTFTGWTYDGVTTPRKNVTINTIGNKEFTANWSAITYTISYDLSGGTNNSNNPSKYTADKDITLHEPTKTGYTFTGWTYDNVTQPTKYLTTRNKYKNLDLKANWKLAEYTITYYLNGGSNSYYNKTTYTMETTTFSLSQPTKTGYTFAGWTGSNGSTKQTSVSISKGSTGNKYFTANWTATNYSISYNLNGGTNSSSNPSSYTIESGNITLQSPTRNGYTFTGWTGSNGDIKELNPIIKSGSVGDKSFTANWKLITSLIIPEGTTNINSYQYKNWDKMESVTIPDSVTSIGEGAFDGCSRLQNVYISNLESWFKIDFSGSSSNPLYYANHLYLNDTELTEITIPETITEIKKYALSKSSSITSITIPKSVTNIEGYAFYYCCGLKAITIPNSVTSIGNYAFSGCSNLKEVHISSLEAWLKINFNVDDSNPLTIAHHLYLNGTELVEINIPDSITEIKHRAFSGASSVTSITIPNSVTSIGYSAFSGCSSLTSIIIPNSVTSIWDGAFGCSSLTSITIPNSVTKIGDCTFSGCSSLTSITIPNSVTSIGNLAFSDCSSLTSITIPNSVTSIGYCAFSGCSSLTSITIPNSVKGIYGYAFQGCSSLTIYCEATSKPTNWSSSWNCSNRPVYWYSETKPTKSGNYWHYVDGEVTKW